MNIIDDPALFIPPALEAIRKYGYAPEHNVDWFLCYGNANQTSVFVSWPDDTGIMAKKEPQVWHLFSEPLAPACERGKCVADLAEHMLQDERIEKIVIEARTETREEILNALPPHLKSRSIEYTLTWPIMDMDMFDPKLPGRHFKSMRKEYHTFYRDHAIEVVDAATLDKNVLHGMVNRWEAALREKKTPDIRPDQYHRLVDANFRGTKTARAMVVDGAPVGFNAGWEVPNSKTFYTAVGIHDYSLPELGIILYLEDLLWLKQHGYKMVDTGGVDAGGPLEFKNKFLPVSWYETHVFSIVRK